MAKLDKQAFLHKCKPVVDSMPIGDGSDSVDVRAFTIEELVEFLGQIGQDEEGNRVFPKETLLEMAACALSVHEDYSGEDLLKLGDLDLLREIVEKAMELTPFGEVELEDAEKNSDAPSSEPSSPSAPNSESP